MTKQYPPGPNGNRLLGSMMDFRRDPVAFLMRGAETHGDVVYFRIGPYRVYLMSHPDLVQEVLVKQSKRIEKTDFNKNLLGKFLGNGILTSDGAFHTRQRRLVQPAFHMQRIANYAQVMVDYTLDMLEGWQADQQYDIDDAMMKLTMKIVSKTLFDAELPAEANDIGNAVAALQEITVEEFKSGLSLPDWLPTPRNRRRKAATKVLDKAVLQFVKDRRASGEDKGDLLSMLLLAQDEDDGGMMDDQQVRDEAVTLFAAGHETTSNALTWTWYLLSQHPEVMTRLQDEVDSVLGGRPPTLDDLAQLKYTEMVIKESMRLYPPAWILMSRTPKETVNIGGYQIDPGDWIYVSPYVTHRNPEFFPNPESFDPEHFTEDNEAALPRYAYFPFGGGARVCIGNSFALMEARLILATVVQRYRLELVPGQEIVPEPEITLRPRNGLQMTVQPRNTDVGVGDLAAETASSD